MKVENISVSEIEDRLEGKGYVEFYPRRIDDKMFNENECQVISNKFEDVRVIRIARDRYRIFYKPEEKTQVV